MSNSQSRVSQSTLDKRLLELSSLFEVSRTLTSTLNLQTILENVLRIPMGHMLVGRGMILLQRGDCGPFIVEAVKGMSRQLVGRELDVDSPPSRSMILKESGDCPDWCEFFKRFEIHLLTPLVSNRGTIGFLALGAKISGDEFEEDEIEFLDSLSNIASTSVSNGLMVQEIQAVNRRLDRKIQQLNTIFDIGGELNSTLDSSKIGSILAFAVMGELLVNRCVVLVRDQDRSAILTCKGVNREKVEPMLNAVCELTEPLFLDETGEHSVMHDMGLALVVPMRLQQQTRGALILGPKISGNRFEDTDLEFLTTLGNQAMTSIENARLFESELEKQRLEEELNLARSIQQGLLPKKIPQPDGYEIAGMNIPSRQVGGDYFDVLTIEEETCGIAIGDVSGKGAGAALLMANLQAGLQALIPSRMGLGSMMSQLNRQIHRNTDPEKYITFFYGELDAAADLFHFCNCGHNPPLLVRKSGEIVSLSEGGLILGMMPEVVYKTDRVDLHPGDRIVMYTDGITEAMNSDGEEFGEERLKQVIQGCGDLSARALMQLIEEAVRAFGVPDIQDDDMTMIVMRRKEEDD